MADISTGTLAITLAIMLVASAFFSIAETAMMASNRYRLKHRAQRGNRGARLALGLLAQTDRLLGVILFGNNLINAGAATLAGLITGRLLGEGELALAAGTVAVTFLILVFSEITPKVIGATHADRIAPMVAFVLSPAGAHWCGGDCTSLLRQALVAAVDDLRQLYGADPTAWRWGEAHEAVFAHPILRAFPVLRWLTTQRVAVGGDDGTVNRHGARPALGARGFDSVHGAAYRGVYDLADLDRSRFVVAPGQSGHPLSRHAGDFISRWRDGGTITLGALPERVKATLRLTP